VAFAVTEKKPNKGLIRTLSIGCPRLADFGFFVRLLF